MDLMEIGCEDGRWMELAEDRVQWWALVLAVLNRCVLLPESWLISKMDLMEIGSEDGKWMELAWDRVQLVGFGISSVEPLCSATRELVN